MLRPIQLIVPLCFVALAIPLATINGQMGSTAATDSADDGARLVTAPTGLGDQFNPMALRSGGLYA
jgi:hypothetical protein